MAAMKEFAGVYYREGASSGPQDHAVWSRWPPRHGGRITEPC